VTSIPYEINFLSLVPLKFSEILELSTVGSTAYNQVFDFFSSFSQTNVLKNYLNTGSAFWYPWNCSYTSLVSYCLTIEQFVQFYANQTAQIPIHKFNPKIVSSQTWLWRHTEKTILTSYIFINQLQY